MRHSHEFSTKTAEDDPAGIVTKALDEFRDSVKGEVSALTDRLSKLEAKAARPGAPAVIVKADDEAATERKAFGDYLRFGSSLPAESQKALNVSSDPQGGFFAPAEISTEITRNIVLQSPVRLVASVRSTSAPSVVYPKRTSVTNAAWHGELQTRTGSEPGFGQNEVIVRQLSTYVDISNALLADAPAALDEVTIALAEDFAQKEGAAFVNGTGVLDPEGLWTNAAVVEVPTLNTSLSASFDPLLNAMHALPAVVRNRGTWLMSGASLAELRKIAISAGAAGAYAWNENLSDGFSAKLFGRDVLELPDAPAPGNNTKPIIFGDINAAYRILDRSEISILVDPYSQAVSGLTRIHATRRVGGAVINPTAIVKIRQAAS